MDAASDASPSTDFTSDFVDLIAQVNRRIEQEVVKVLTDNAHLQQQVSRLQNVVNEKTTLSDHLQQAVVNLETLLDQHKHDIKVLQEKAKTKAVTTNETIRKFDLANKRLGKKYDEVLAINKALGEQNKELIAINQDLGKQNELVFSKNAALTKENHALTSQVNVLTEQHQAALAESTRLANELEASLSLAQQSHEQAQEPPAQPSVVAETIVLSESEDETTAVDLPSIPPVPQQAPQNTKSKVKRKRARVVDDEEEDLEEGDRNHIASKGVSQRRSPRQTTISYQALLKKIFSRPLSAALRKELSVAFSCLHGDIYFTHAAEDIPDGYIFTKDLAKFRSVMLKVAKQYP